jgi:hypothetical protein
VREVHLPLDSYQSTHGQPIHEADTTLFDQSSAATQVPLEITKQLVEEITAEVLNTLKASSDIPPIAQVASQPIPARPPQPYRPRSPPSTDSGLSRGLISTPTSSPTRRSSNASSLTDPLSYDQQHVARARTEGEETVLEKIWQPLFDYEGKPTARLGQFLRGLALCLVCARKFYDKKQQLTYYIDGGL